MLVDQTRNNLILAACDGRLEECKRLIETKANEVDFADENDDVCHARAQMR